MPNLFTRRQVQGFTLIELLVVIAIISLLAAILFPVFATAREKARQSSCASNMKQMAVGLLQYTQDYDEYPPSGIIMGHVSTPTPNWNQNADTIGQGWATQLYTYVKSINLYQCPDDPSKPSVNGFPISYAYNNNLLLGPANVAAGTAPAGIAALNAPSKTIMFTEGQSSPDGVFTRVYDILGNNIPTWLVRVNSGGSYNSGFYEDSPISHGTDYTDEWDDSAGGSADTCVAGYLSDVGYLCGDATPTKVAGASMVLTGIHSGGANYVFFDGHVKWMMGNLVSPGLNAVTSGKADSSATQTTTASSAKDAAGTAGKFASGATPAATYSIT